LVFSSNFSPIRQVGLGGSPADTVLAAMIARIKMNNTDRMCSLRSRLAKSVTAGA
jgi:hypothetical protein